MNDPQLNIDPTEDDVWGWNANASANAMFYQPYNRNAAVDSDFVTTVSAGIAGQNGSSLMPGYVAGVSAMQSITGNLTQMMFNHNGKFTFNPASTSGLARVVDFQQYGRDKLACVGGLSQQCLTASRGSPSKVQDGAKTQPIGSEFITFAEQGGVNTGVFGNWDGSRTSAIVTLTPQEESGFGAYPAQSTIRGQSATFRYPEAS
jgi:hypothetical protein